MAERFNQEDYMATIQDRPTRIVVDKTHLTINVDDNYKYEIALALREDGTIAITQLAGWMSRPSSVSPLNKSLSSWTGLTRLLRGQ